MAPRGEKHREDGDGSIFRIYSKRKDGTIVERWRAEFTIGYDHAGKRVVAQGQGATKQIARDRREAARLKLLVLQGKAPRSVLTGEKHAVRRETVQEYLEKWFATLDPEEVGDQTRRSYRSKLELHIYPHIGEIPLLLLTEEDIHTLFHVTLKNKVYDPKRPELRISNGGLLNIWKPLSKALSMAENKGKIPLNPMRSVKKPKVEEREETIYSWKPKYLLEQLDGDPDEAKWLLSFVLGLRMSEKIGLTWDCLNLKPRGGKPATVTIKQQLQWQVSEHGCGKRDNETALYPCGYRSSKACPKQIGGGGLHIVPVTKTAAGKRTLPLPTQLQKLLLEHQKRQAAVKKMDTGTKDWDPLPGLDNLVFTTANGRPMSQQLENKAWHALCEKFNVPVQRGHLNRHVVATLLAEAEVPPERAQLILGWSSARMLSTYTHLRAVKHAVEPIQDLERVMLERQTSARSRAVVKAKKLADKKAALMDEVDEEEAV